MKSKIGFLIFGLLAGVAIGVVFDVGIKAVFHQIRDLHISLSKIDKQQNQISQRLDSIQGKLKDNKKTATPVAPVKASAPITKESNPTKSTSDNADSNISEVENGSGDSNVVVMTNQLITFTTLPVKNIDSTKASEVSHKSDSVLASMSQVDEESEPSYYRIEFWQSPLNFKGYKMSRGKLILYGINSTSHVSIVKCDDEYYLLANQSAYKVAYTDEYKPFERVTDKTVLKKFSL